MAFGRFRPWEKSPRIQRTWRSLAIIPLLFLLVLGTLFTLHTPGFGHSTGVQASGLAKLPGHVPGLIKKSTLLGRADPNTPTELLIGLHPRNEASLKVYVETLARPHSTTAHRYLTPAQVAATFGALLSSQDAVIAYMQQAGFSESQTFRHHLLIAFTGTIGEAEKAFHIQINNYRAPSGRQYYAPMSDPSVPIALSSIIQSISGLDTARIYTHPPIISKKQANTSNATPHSTSCMAAEPGTAYNYYIPGQIMTAYNLTGLYNAGFRGEGQTVALYELDNYVSSDISAYTSCYGGSGVPISRIVVNGRAPAAPDQGAIEVELDMELVLSAAPHLASLRVYEAANDTVDAIAEWSQIVSDAVPIVSTSWGSCESSNFAQAIFQQENTLFMLAAVQGQTILAASGDQGSNDCGYTTPTAPSVDDPASQPYVTGAGGTTLAITSGSNYGTETAWNDGNGNASGGGVSGLWRMPGWQAGPGVISAASSGVPCGAPAGSYCREVPDVAYNADPHTGYEIYCTALDQSGTGPCNPNAPWITVGGTSAAAPMWAAMIALANEKSLHDGNFNLGFLNPLLYQIGQNNSSTSYNNDFHDVTAGNNYTTADGNNEFQATANYDMVTGLGSYNALSLANDLELLAKNQTSARTSPASNTWYFAEGSVGGSFTEYITLLNPSPTQAATVSITYLFQNKPAVTVQHLVNPSIRFTANVNADLGVASTAPQQAISAIVQSTPVPIVAERPMYFNFRGIKSGTDVMGATNATNKLFYFAEADNRQAGATAYSTFVSILNPSQVSTAHVQITYYSHGSVVETDTLSVGPLQRGTGIPRLHQQFAVKVTSDIGIVVERPMYFNDNVPTAGGWTTGAASAVGATTLGPNTGSDWLFAEGYTGNGTDFQEYLVLANFTTTNATVSVKLEYTNGTVQTVPVTVMQQSQYYFDVNYAFSHPVSGCGCTPTGSVSAEVTSSTPSIVAERLMYFHYGSSRLSGGTDVVGEAGPSSHAVYTFAEGYTYGSFTEYLTLQNPNNTAEPVAITLFADNTIVQEMLQLQPHSRSTVNINNIVVPLATAYPTIPAYQGFEVSMDIQAFSTGGGAPATVVAERPLYFNYFGDPGGTDVLGYTGG
jgi:kumamolisin